MSEQIAMQELVGLDTGFKSVKWLNNIYDTNQGVNYSEGNINFDTKGFTDDKWIHHHEGYITVPCSVTGTTTDFVYLNRASIKVAVKNGIYQLIHRCQVKLNGTIIENANNINFWNHVKRMVDEDIEYADSQGVLYHEAKDTTEFSDYVKYKYVTTAVPAVAAGASASAIAATIADVAENLKFNKGFADRVKLLNPYFKQKGATDAFISFTAVIPLRYLSDFFEQLKFPILDMQLELQLGISGRAGNSVQPFMIDSASRGTYGEPKFIIAKEDQANYPPSENSACRLWLPEVEMTDEAKLALTKSSLSKTVAFHSAKVVKTTVAGNTAIEFPLTQTFQMPRRLWVLIMDPNKQKDSDHASPCCTASKARLTRANLLIDGQQLFPNDIEHEHQFYKLFKDELFNGGEDYSNGSLVSWADFSGLGIHKYYVFNMTKFMESHPNPLKSFNLTFRGTVVGDPAVTYDVYFLVEHEVNVAIKMREKKAIPVGSI